MWITRAPGARKQKSCVPHGYNDQVTDSSWSLDATRGDLLVRTDVGGPAAKMGHRLTIAMRSWRATVEWRGSKAVAARLDVDLDSLEVLKGEGGVTPLSGPEKLLVRANALKSLGARKYPKVTFSATDITEVPGGYRLAGTLEIHGTARPQSVDLHTEERDGTSVMSARVPITQSDYGIKPYSLMMGTLKVADVVTVEFTGAHPK